MLRGQSGGPWTHPSSSGWRPGPARTTSRRSNEAAGVTPVRTQPEAVYEPREVKVVAVGLLSATPPGGRGSSTSHPTAYGEPPARHRKREDGGRVGDGGALDARRGRPHPGPVGCPHRREAADGRPRGVWLRPAHPALGRASAGRPGPLQAAGARVRFVQACPSILSRSTERARPTRRDPMAVSCCVACKRASDRLPQSGAVRSNGNPTAAVSYRGYSGYKAGKRLY
jgi:hypothetical protein